MRSSTIKKHKHTSSRRRAKSKKASIEDVIRMLGKLANFYKANGDTRRNIAYKNAMNNIQIWADDNKKKYIVQSDYTHPNKIKGVGKGVIIKLNQLLGKGKV